MSALPTSPFALVSTTVARLTGRPPDTVLADQRLIADLGFDSVRLVELVLELDLFGLPISLEQVLAAPDLDVQSLAALASGIPNPPHPTRPQ
jgi:acyl carrier protein